MGSFGDTLTAFIFFFLAIIIISSTSITIYTYNKDKKTPDLNYWWSVTCLVFAILGLIISGFMFFKSGKADFQTYSASAGSGEAAGGATNALKVAESQARNIANAAVARATAASNASKAVELAKAAGIRI